MWHLQKQQGLQKFVVFLCSRDVHRKMGLSWSRSLDLKNIIAPWLVFEFCLKVANMFRKYNIQCLSSRMSHSCATVNWDVFHAVDHFLQLLAEWIERVILLQVGLQRFFIQMRLALVNQLFDCFLADANLFLEKNYAIHHVWNCPLSVCLWLGLRWQNDWFGFWCPNWVCQKSQSSATLWVLDTCLIVGLRPLMIILITLHNLQKMKSIAPNWEHLTFEET